MKLRFILVAAFFVFGWSAAVSADQKLYTFPSPTKVKVEDVLNMGGTGSELVMDLDDFCELNKENIPQLVPPLQKPRYTPKSRGTFFSASSYGRHASGYLATDV